MAERASKIVIADDEREIRDIVTVLMKGEGYKTLACESGEEVLTHVDESVDLYILDVNMPGLSGFMTAAEIRKTQETPIIFLTAYSGESDKVMGFSAGADDYIVKPFSNIELIMRVKAVLKRTRKTAQVSTEPESQLEDGIRIGDLILSKEKKSVIKDGETIPLTYTEFMILELLASNKGRIYSLDDIYEKIWGDNAVGDSSIMVHIKNLRKKTGDNSRNPKYIKTAWGRGYYVE
ncbi:MAG: response regulator transcription factor [Clostridia bacterium]|nr:response regulator transcription factor [Clostridia bacterium]MDO5302810.1 response regulator transcription factor [Clostridia bacterium]